MALPRASRAPGNLFRFAELFPLGLSPRVAGRGTERSRAASARAGSLRTANIEVGRSGAAQWSAAAGKRRSQARAKAAVYGGSAVPDRRPAVKAQRRQCEQHPSTRIVAEIRGLGRYGGGPQSAAFCNRGVRLGSSSRLNPLFP